MRNFELNFSERRTFVFSDVCMTLRSFCESYSSNWSQDFLCSSAKSIMIPAALCPEIRNPTVVHLSVFNYCTFVTILLRLFAGLSLNLPVCKRALIAEFTTRFRLVEFGRMPKVTRLFSANTFQEVFVRLSIELPRWTPASEVLVPRQTSTSLCWWLRGWSCFSCRFCTLILVVPETLLVSSRTLPFCFPWIANSLSSFNTT